MENRKDVVICVNCKSYFHKGVKECPECGGKTFEDTHSSNFIFIKNDNSNASLEDAANLSIQITEPTDDEISEFAEKYMKMVLNMVDKEPINPIETDIDFIAAKKLLGVPDEYIDSEDNSKIHFGADCIKWQKANIPTNAYSEEQLVEAISMARKQHDVGCGYMCFDFTREAILKHIKQQTK